MTGMSDLTLRRLRVVDLETTGNGFADGGVVEIGWQDVVESDGAWQLVPGGPASRLVRPPFPITPATAAIHHIVDADVAASPAWPGVAPSVLERLDGPPIRAFAAHRAAFEQRWCAGFGRSVPWICTWKCALRVWPDAPTHSNQGLRYWRDPAGLDRATGLPAHRAGPDAYVTAHHLRDLLAAAPLEALLRWSAEPALLIRVPQGPFRGRLWPDLADEALDALASGAHGQNADLLFTARHERRRREAIGAGDGAAAATEAVDAQATLLL